MKKSSLLFLALTGALFIYSCEKKSETQETAQQDTTQKQTAQGPTEEDKKFMSKAAEDGMLEVQLGQLASQKATSSEVKSLGEMLVSQHQTANEELKQIASTKNVTLPDSLDDQGKDMLKKLQEKKANQFDKDFIKEIVDEHKKDIKDFEDAAQKTQDADLKAWIDKTLPHLQHHLMEAQKIDSTMSASKTKKSMIKK